MRITSTYPINHIKVHLVCEETKARLHRSLRSLSKKVSESTEKIVIASVGIFIGLLFVTVLMKLGECSTMTTNHCDICDLIPKMISMP